MRWFRPVGLSAVASIAWLAAESSSASQTTAIKTFALNPAEYLGRSMRLEGTVRAVGPGESWLILEDETGRVLVTTAHVGSALFCESGADAVIEGRLSFLGEEHGLYFSMDSLESCSRSAHPVNFHFARAYRFLRSLFL